MQETWVQSLGWENPLEKEMATRSSVLVRESHWQRSLEGYSPRGCQESKTTECTHTYEPFADLINFLLEWHIRT